MKIAINQQYKDAGKLEMGDSRWNGFNGAFQNVEVSPDQLIELILQGCSITAQHHTYRKVGNFVCAQHLGIDLDELPAGTTLQDVAQEPFYARFASFLYTTPSHTNEAPKMRVVFELDRPIHNAEKYGLLATALVNRFQTADQSAKDPARFFYGSKGGQSLTLGNVLTLEDAARELVKPYQAQQAEEQRKAAEAARNRVVTAADNVPAAWLQKHSESLLNRVRTAPDGEKYVTLRDTAITFGGYVGGGYYNEIDVIAWLKAAIRRNTGKVGNFAHADATIEESVSYGRSRPLYFEVQKPEQQNVITPDDVRKAVDTAYWRGFHDGMSQAQRQKLHLQGLNDVVIDTLNIGFCGRKIDEDTGEILVKDAVTVPYFDASGNVVNIEYRNGSISYENEQAAIYRVSEQFGDENSGRWLVFPDSLTAIDAYLGAYGEGFTVMGLPHINAQIDQSGLETAVVVLEPNETPESAIGLREKGKYVRLPMPFQKMVKSGYTPMDFNWLIQQARGY